MVTFYVVHCKFLYFVHDENCEAYLLLTNINVCQVATFWQLGKMPISQHLTLYIALHTTLRTSHYRRKILLSETAPNNCAKKHSSEVGLNIKRVSYRSKAERHLTLGSTKCSYIKWHLHFPHKPSNTNASKQVTVS